jgi:hypothetical protein
MLEAQLKAGAIKLLGLSLLLSTSALCQDFLYADQCSGTDIGAKIMSCQSSLPTATSGYKVGTIILPNTSSEPALATWSTAVVLGPGVNLTGQGLWGSSFNCTVAGDCLRHNASASSGPNAHSVLPNTVYQGFTIAGNGAAGQNIVDFWDATGVTVRDVAADGAKESGGACFLFQDANWWTERNLFENVSSLYNCNIGWRFIVQPGNKYGPHPSFGYNRFLDIELNPNSGQTGFSFENDAYFYNSTLRATVNLGGTSGATVIKMSGTAEFYFNEVHLYGEDDSSGGPTENTLLDLTSSSNQFTYTGDINFTAAENNSIASGAVVTHWLDSWAYFNAAQDQFGNSVLFSDGYTDEVSHGEATNAANWIRGNGGPNGSCATGSLYSNTSGSSGSTLYVCVESKWVDIE